MAGRFGVLFEKKHSEGGVLLDLGVHVLDLISWWFGEPSEIRYLDDAMGNLEANCQLQLSYPSGVSGEVRLSRDTPFANRYVIAFERGEVSWRVGEANQLDVRFSDTPFQLTGELRHPAANSDHSAPVGPLANSYHQSFVSQILNVVAAVRGLEPLQVPVEEALPSQRLIDRCYSNRQQIPMPWLSPAELVR